MVGTVIDALGDGNVVIALGKGAVILINIPDELAVIRIAPELRVRVIPGNISFDLHAVRQLVEDDVFHIGVIGHDQADVMEVVEEVASFIPDKAVTPILIFPDLEIILRRRLLFLQEKF